MLETISERATSDDNSCYKAPRDDDEAAERANGFDNLRNYFVNLAGVPIWTEDQKKSLNQCAAHFSIEADSLRENLPVEPDYDGSDHERSDSEDANISELFRDL
ncbi:MAG: hypothetical protein KGJ60_05370 [Verrucomicrobiota bacterium]|nr:hypothetical protein [Verrucomicrobiota bacterium]